MARSKQHVGTHRPGKGMRVLHLYQQAAASTYSNKATPSHGATLYELMEGSIIQTATQNDTVNSHTLCDITLTECPGTAIVTCLLCNQKFKTLSKI